MLACGCLALPCDDYDVTLMNQKGVDADTSKLHHERMTKMKATLTER